MISPHIQAGLLALILCTSLRADNASPAPELPKIPDKTFSVADYGAVGDGKTMNTDALQKAISAVDKAGGGTLMVPAGQYLTQPLTLVSNLNLQLAKGAAILISDDIAKYPMERKGYQNGISASDAHDLEISGEGTIDGQGKAWWTAFEANKDMPHRPFLVRLEHCTRVKVTGILLTNSPSFHLVPNRCTDVTIQGITIKAPVDAHNTDGIDPSGSNFLITDCLIDGGDDNIAVKPAGTEQNRNFMITHCDFQHGHGMSIGSGTNGGLDGLTVSNCTFEGTNAGIRIKTARGRGGLVQNVVYDHLTMTGVKSPVEIVDYYPHPPKTPEEDPAQPVTPLTPTFANVMIRNVTSTDSPSAGSIWGLPEAPITGITFDNVHITAKKGMQIVHAKDIHFTNSDIIVEKGDKLTLFDAQADGLK
jgi:polygalacturonase